MDIFFGRMVAKGLRLYVIKITIMQNNALK